MAILEICGLKYQEIHDLIEMDDIKTYGEAIKNIVNQLKCAETTKLYILKMLERETNAQEKLKFLLEEQKIIRLTSNNKGSTKIPSRKASILLNEAPNVRQPDNFIKNPNNKATSSLFDELSQVQGQQLLPSDCPSLATTSVRKKEDTDRTANPFSLCHEEFKNNQSIFDSANNVSQKSLTTQMVSGKDIQSFTETLIKQENTLTFFKEFSFMNQSPYTSRISDPNSIMILSYLKTLRIPKNVGIL